ncbi:MAG: hypothetical protein ACI9TH_002753 [Kiritimatiellia bacterium]|jgi:hypothetical protein
MQTTTTGIEDQPAVVEPIDRSHAPAHYRSSAEWISHFQQNVRHQRAIPWETDTTRLTERERRAIARSIAIFQLGESSDGHFFFEAGRQYVKQSADIHYTDALRLFIAEENRHSAYLGRFMQLQEIPFEQKQWSDSIFRMIRKVSGLEMCISVLITAELVAKVYYRALSEATDSPTLKAICDQILQDESWHLAYQSGTLGKIRRGRSLYRLAVTETLQKLFMLGTLVVVWMDHARVFRAGGYTFMGFARETWTELRRSLQVIRECVIFDWRKQRILQRVQGKPCSIGS